MSKQVCRSISREIEKEPNPQEMPTKARLIPANPRCSKILFCSSKDKLPSKKLNPKNKNAIIMKI
ncbi:MAG: hypothetical protein BroJett040_17950 [Oligoflexia bacterium]|nr:MAG: hypothetical protein BroJett040_17950 [Oligoflexia bacterium]